MNHLFQGEILQKECLNIQFCKKALRILYYYYFREAEIVSATQDLNRGESSFSVRFLSFDRQWCSYQSKTSSSLLNMKPD